MKAVGYAFLFFLLLISTLAYAQQTGTVNGKVLDDDKQPIAGASVELVGTNFKVTANPAGEYTIPDVPAGNYTVRAVTYSY